MRPRTPILLLLLAGAAALGWARFGNRPEAGLEVWYGPHQRVGHLGTPQPDYNLLGVASGTRLTYALNGAPPRELSLGEGTFGFRRLGAAGHFNADIPIADLREGPNEVLLVAEGRGAEARATVTIERIAGAPPSLPLSLRWSELDDPLEAGQAVDGLWTLEDGGLRSAAPLYDRLFLVGDPAWTDYEVRTSVTLHRVAARTGPTSGAPGVGVILRFAGHTVDPPRFPDAQPKWGFQPFGAILWLRWSNGGAGAPPVPQFYRGDRNASEDGAPLVAGDRYELRARCDTDPEDPRRTRYRLRAWPAGTEEPDGWDLDVTQESDEALRAGGVCLVAHHVDVTFGDLRVTPAGD